MHVCMYIHFLFEVEQRWEESDKRREKRVQIKWRERYQRQRTKGKDEGKDKGGNTVAVALGEIER